MSTSPFEQFIRIMISVSIIFSTIQPVLVYGRESDYPYRQEATATATVEVTATEEATATETAVVEPTETETVIAATATETTVAEPSETETATAAATATETAVAGPTETETAIATASAVASETPVATETPVETGTPVETATPTDTAVAPATETATVEATTTATETVTATAIPSESPTATATETTTIEATASITATETASPTPTGEIPLQLELTMETEPAFVTAGEVVTVSINLQNSNQADLEGLQLQALLPTEVVYLQALNGVELTHNPLLNMLIWNVPPGNQSEVSLSYELQILANSPASALNLSVEIVNGSQSVVVQSQSSLIVAASATATP